jgi:hypothetical protein
MLRKSLPQSLAQQSRGRWRGFMTGQLEPLERPGRKARKACRASQVLADYIKAGNSMAGRSKRFH